MDLYTAIRNVLIADGTTAALVTDSVTGVVRVYRAWQQGYSSPAVVIQIDSNELQNDLSGHSGLTIGEVYITCRHDVGSGADALKNAVIAVLSGYSGAFDLIIDTINGSVTPKQEGSDSHWHDWTLSCTPLVSEVV